MLGGRPTASRGNASLEPLESTNLDLSVEWYYSDSSYASIGFFTKAVNNFVGTGVSNHLCSICWIWPPARPAH